jgi:GNAT superfamily N-acetyltransferase
MEARGALWIARDQGGEPIGYAFATLDVGPDDTFESRDTAELVSLIVDESLRGSGVGQALVQAVKTTAA